MLFRKPLDIGYRDLLWGLGRCWGPSRPHNNDSEASIFHHREVLPVFSVRSGFDLLLESLNLESGSEILMTAITIPDMPKIVSNRGLVPVPLDIDSETLQPSTESIRAACTRKTKAIVVAHLFGNAMDLEPIGRIANELGLTLIEDSAQAFRSNRTLGDSKADISMFSFGTIKTLTCLGGGLMVLRKRPALYRAMSRKQATYLQQSKSEFATKLIKAVAIKLVTSPYAFQIVYRISKLIGFDYDDAVHRASKSFPKDRFFERIRRRPSKPLLDLMDRRLGQADGGAIAQRGRQGEKIARDLGPSVMVPGSQSSIRTHWVFPIQCDNGQALVEALRQHGFDATSRCSLEIVPGDDSSRTSCPQAQSVLDRIVFLPIENSMAQDEYGLMRDLIHEHAARYA